MAPGSETSLRAYNVSAHAAAPLPPVLASVQGTDYIVTDGTRTAYLSPDFPRLYYSPAQDQPGVDPPLQRLHPQRVQPRHLRRSQQMRGNIRQRIPAPPAQRRTERVPGSLGACHVIGPGLAGRLGRLHAHRGEP